MSTNAIDESGSNKSRWSDSSITIQIPLYHIALPKPKRLIMEGNWWIDHFSKEEEIPKNIAYFHFNLDLFDFHKFKWLLCWREGKKFGKGRICKFLLFILKLLNFPFLVVCSQQKCGWTCSATRGSLDQNWAKLSTESGPAGSVKSCSTFCTNMANAHWEHWNLTRLVYCGNFHLNNKLRMASLQRTIGI